jgi:hypothetical protein
MSTSEPGSVMQSTVTLIDMHNVEKKTETRKKKKKREKNKRKEKK